MKKVLISDVKPNADNPRTIIPEQLEKLKWSILEFPEMMKIRPIVYDENNVNIGGNMRQKAILAIKAMGTKDVVDFLTKIGKEANMPKIRSIFKGHFPDGWAKQVNWSKEQKQEFIIKDNVGFGEWNWQELSGQLTAEQLEHWGVEDWEKIDIGTDGFELPSGDKSPFQQQTFTLADEQALLIKGAITKAEKTAAYKTVETHGNENSNGNALYLIVREWAELKK